MGKGDQDGPCDQPHILVDRGETNNMKGMTTLGPEEVRDHLHPGRNLPSLRRRRTQMKVLWQGRWELVPLML